MAEKCEASGEQTVTDVLRRDDVRGGLCVSKGEGAKKPWISVPCDQNSDEVSEIEDTTPAERGWRHWHGKGVALFCSIK